VNEIVRLGLDIDGTITAAPDRFAALAGLVRQAKGSVHVVTSRSVLGRTGTVAELREYQVAYDEIYFLPEISQAQALCPHPHLDWFNRHRWLKVDYAVRHRLTHFVDDDVAVLKLFREFAPMVVALSPLDALSDAPFIGTRK